MIRASASQPVGRGFEPRPSHTKDFTTGTHCLLVWRSVNEKGVGKLNTRSYQWTSPPVVALTAFADAWPRAIEMEIGAALCAIGAGRTLTLRAHRLVGTAFHLPIFHLMLLLFVCSFCKYMITRIILQARYYRPLLVKTSYIFLRYVF